MLRKSICVTFYILHMSLSKKYVVIFVILHLQNLRHNSLYLCMMNYVVGFLILSFCVLIVVLSWSVFLFGLVFNKHYEVVSGKELTFL